MVAHRESARFYADQILVLDDGKIVVGKGTHEKTAGLCGISSSC
ncbi:MAG: hypothetical protein ACLRYY_06255 [Anaerobutyricum soehngenii]